MAEIRKEKDEKPLIIKKEYHCSVCQTTHTIEIPSNLAESRKKYPFPYVFIHSSEDDKNDIVSMLYFDKNLKIRGSEAVKLEQSNLVSKNLTKQLVSKLTNIIMDLEEENFQLKNLLNSPHIEEIIREESRNLKKSLLGEYKKRKKRQKPQGSHHRKKKVKPKVPKKDTSREIFVYFTSTVGPEEQTKRLIIDKTITIAKQKRKIGKIFGLIPANFHLASGGLSLKETRTLQSYNISPNDEILIIPSSTAGAFYFG
ncbi:MAG: hypothetical protein R6U96_18890 [Promethearchaeia archaeon]